MFLIGVDIGTGGCGTTVVDENGKVLTTAFQEYNTKKPKSGWREQDPEDWIDATKATLKKVLNDPQLSPSEIASICIDGFPHTPVLLDEDRKVLRPPIIYTDKRSQEEADLLNEEHGEKIFEITYNRPSPAWTMPMLLWIKRNEEEVWSNIGKLILPKDYVRFKLTGKLATDFTDAASTLLMDMEDRSWSNDLCDIIGLPRESLPEIISPVEVVGEIREADADGGGLEPLEGTPIVAGADDVCAENFGAGLIEEGQFSLKLATTGRVSWLTEKPYEYEEHQDRVVTYPHVSSDTLLSGLAFTSPSESLRWLRDTFCKEEVNVAEGTGKSVYELMDMEAEKVPEGSRGLIFHPHLGSFESKVKGNFFGVQDHHQKNHFIRALLEGVAFSLRRSYELLRNEMLKGKDVRLEEEAVLLGGGAKSNLWSDIMVNVFGIPMRIPQNADASYGTALLGGIGVRIFDDFSDALKLGQNRPKRLRPDQEAKSLYDDLYSVYTDIEEFLPNPSEKIEKICKEGT